MSIIKNLSVIGALALLPFSLGLCDQEPRVAVGLTGSIGIYNPLTSEQLLRKDFPLSSNNTSNAPIYLSFLDPSSNNLLVSFNHNNIWLSDGKGNVIPSEPSTESLQTACLVVKNGDTCEIVVSTRAGDINVYDAVTGANSKPFDFMNHQGVSSLAMYRQGEGIFLVAGTAAGFIDIYNYETRKCVQSINTYENNGFYEGSYISNVLVFAHDNSVKVIASTTQMPARKSSQLGCWDTVTGIQSYVVPYSEEPKVGFYGRGDIYSLELYKDNGALKLVTSATDEGKIKIWDPVTGTCIQTLYDQRFAQTASLAVRVFQSKDETGEVTKLVAGYWSGEIAVWNTKTEQVEAYVNQNQNLPEETSKLVRFITLFHDAGQKYCTVGNDAGDVYAYELESLTSIKSWSAGQHSISALANPQELLINSAKSQLGFFSMMIGCYVPYFDVQQAAIEQEGSSGGSGSCCFI